MQAQNKRLLFAPERREVGRGIIFGAVSAALIGAFMGVLLAAGLCLIGVLMPASRILPHSSNTTEVVQNILALCFLGALGGAFSGFQIGIFTSFVQFIFVAVWVPPGNWEIIRRGYRRGMLYGAILGVACCAPVCLWGQIDALTAGYSQAALNGFRDNFIGCCFILLPAGLMIGSAIAMVVAVGRIRAGKEYRTPFPLPYPFHKW